MKNDNAQMMVLESIIFAITVFVSLIFLTQISPTSIPSSSESSNELKLLGDDALNTIYSETLNIKGLKVDAKYSTNNPSSKLTVCIITNNVAGLVNSLNGILPSTVFYNVYISNGTKTVFWCSFTGSTTDPFPMCDPVAISRHIISIDPKHMTDFSNDPNFDTYNGLSESSIYDDFSTYQGSSYEVILEMSYCS